MITVKNIPERREAVTAINVYDRENGLNSSQRAKYERPLWAFIAAILVGNDRSFAMSPTSIQNHLKKHNIHVTLPAITRTLNVMINLDKSIHPHRRNCGISCYEAVSRMGGIKTWRCNTPGYIDGHTLYSFDSPQSTVYYQRKAMGLTIQVKP